MDMNTSIYKRVLLKLSGEALAAGSDGIYNLDYIDKTAAVIKRCSLCGVQLGVVVGAGNIWRGRLGEKMDRTRADYMGMLATAINSIMLQDAFERAGLKACVMTAVAMHEFAEPYVRTKAISHLEKGRVVIFGCGLGSPFFSTDTAAVLRAVEINADVILMAKNIDALYTADPKKDPSAVRISEITYLDMLARQLSAIDSTAASLANDNNMPSLLFGGDDPENIYRIIMGEKLGTIVKGEKK